MLKEKLMLCYPENYLISTQNTKHQLQVQNQEWHDLIIWYLSKEQETILLLEKALAEKDFEQIMILGDQIYGHGGSFGFARISLFGKKIELAALEKNTVLLNVLIASLKAYIKYLLPTLIKDSFPTY